MPRKNSNQVGERLSKVTALLAHPLFNTDNENHPYRNILRSFQIELRLLQAGLTDDNPSNIKALNNWCSNKHSIERLNKLAIILDSLSPVESNSQQYPSKNLKDRWAILNNKKDEPTVERNSVNLLIMELLVKQPYTPQQLKLFCLESLDTINPEGKKGSKALKLVKSGGYHAVYVVSELAMPVGKIIKEGMKASVSATKTGVQATSALTGLAPYVPMLGASLTAFYALYDFTKGAVNKMGFSDQAQRGVMLGLATSALALTVAFPGLALAFTAGMIGAGAYMSYMKPYLELTSKEKTLHQQLDELKQREEHIKNNKQDLILTEVEKSALLTELTVHYGKNNTVSLEELSYARELIKSGDLARVSNNYTISSALGNRCVRDVMSTQSEKEVAELNKNVEQVNLQKTKMRQLGINSLFTILGASLIAVPIPPVIIAGIVILTASTVVGLVIKYQNPIKSFFSNIKDKILDGFIKSPDEMDENNHNHRMNENVEVKGDIPMRPLDTGRVTRPEQLFGGQDAAKTQIPTDQARSIAKSKLLQQQDPRSVSKILSEEAITVSRSLKAALPSKKETEKQGDENPQLGHVSPRKGA